MDGIGLADCRVIAEGGEAPTISFKNGRIEAIGAESPSGRVISLNGSFVYPALINAHDHMRGNYLPRVGPQGDNYYVNWAPWDADLKASSTYEERANISVEDMYFLSAYKNIFSGVATVQDHFPHNLNEAFIPKLPLRVIAEYCLAHEASSYDLKWGDGIEIEHQRAVERDWPFITHLEEGYDRESQEGVEILERLGCLDQHDLLIHCIGLSEADIGKIKAAQASVCWCPASNILMFNATCKIRKLLASGVNVALGTDSTHTGSFNLMAEMRYAKEVYYNLYGEELPNRVLFDMVTINPAKAMRIQDRCGSIKVGKSADVLVLDRIKDDPYDNLAAAREANIRLLLLDGQPIYGEEALVRQFGFPKAGTGLRVGGRDMIVRGDPGQLLSRVRKAVGFDKKLEYLPFEA